MSEDKNPKEQTESFDDMREIVLEADQSNINMNAGPCANSGNGCTGSCNHCSN